MLFVYTLRLSTGRCIALSTDGKSPGTVSGRGNADVTTSSLDGGPTSVGGRGNADVSTSSLGGGPTSVGVRVGIYAGWHGNIDVIVD